MGANNGGVEAQTGGVEAHTGAVEGLTASGYRFVPITLMRCQIRIRNKVKSRI
jgi:hypothetical protein